jgi:hypothetical protein
MSLADLIRSPQLPIAEISAFLDDLDYADTWSQLQTLGRDEQRLLYEKAAGSRPLRLDDLVGEAGEGREVINQGMNTLPLPASLRRFQKRVCRPEDSTAGLFGYNEGVTRRLIGPGYFVAKHTSGRPHWQARGGVVVDYFSVPGGKVVDSWPQVVSNSHGLQRFVFRNTRDFLRRVSSTVTVGAAYKFERPLDHYFVLCRRSAN